MIKGSIQEEDITILNIYTPSIGSPQYIRQLLTLKGQINNNTIIVGDFNTPLTAMDRSTRQKIDKETQTLSDALKQRDLIDIYRTFHPKATEYTFFSSLATCGHEPGIWSHKRDLESSWKVSGVPRKSGTHGT
uniref:Endonuclease/exonuclease/phosphatase domain-containing protein n=1 Tax=Sus scrofa TaxID=9823 RepID=A0A8D1BCC4_PIG